jgi:hypothetical protein
MQLTFQGRMKSKAPNPNEEVAQIRHEEDGIMFVAVAICKTFVG